MLFALTLLIIALAAIYLAGAAYLAILWLVTPDAASLIRKADAWSWTKAIAAWPFRCLAFVAKWAWTETIGWLDRAGRERR